MKTHIAIVLVLVWPISLLLHAEPVGPRGHIGTNANPKRVDRLVITKPGIYQNYLVDSNWQGGNRVKVSSNDVTIRNCEIRNASGNGIGIFGRKIVIENCRIHHLLNGSFKDQQDAHGITGRWGDVTIRNCDIGLVSGDSIQFDPDRKSTGRVTVENCRLWTGALPTDAARFKRGQRPGENAFDTKTMPSGPRAELIIRNCLLEGWNQPGQISLMAALNLKENVTAIVENCVFSDNEVACRLRGPNRRGGAWVAVRDCAFYNCRVGIRAEEKIENLKLHRLGFGSGVARKLHPVAGGIGKGHENTGERHAPDIRKAIEKGLR